MTDTGQCSADDAGEGTVLLFATHRWTRSVEREYARLHGALGDAAVILWDRAGDPGEARRVAERPHFNFCKDRLPDLGYDFFHPRGMQPGSVHFPLLWFARRHHHDHYWFVENDVRYTGDWARLLQALSACDADFLTCHLRRWHEDPAWPHWERLSGPRGDCVPRDERLAAFNPIYRVSRRALAFIDAAHVDGWKGHQEVLLPTLLDRAGYRLRDLNEAGREAGLPVPLYRHERTMRFRPHFLRPFPGGRSLLYHPVSPDWRDFVSRRYRYLRETPKRRRARAQRARRAL